MVKAATILLMLVATCSLRAQDTLRTATSLVLLPTLVRDQHNELVFGLEAKDFILTDDGIPQSLRLEQDLAGQPLALVLVLQSGAATQATGWHPHQRGTPPNRFSTLPIMVEAIAGGVKHRVAVIGFDSQPELLQPFTPDFDRVRDKVLDFTAEDNGDHGAAILDGLGMAVALLRTAPQGYRRAILLLSETHDRDSKLPLAQAIQAIGDSNIAIYTLAYSTGAARASKYGEKTLPTKRIAPPRTDGVLTTPADEAGSGGIGTGLLTAMTTGIFLTNDTPNPPGGCMGKDPNADPKVKPDNKLSQGYDCLTQLAPPLAFARMALIAATESMQRNTPETVAQLTGGEYFALSDQTALERDLQTISNHFPNRYLLSFQPHQPHAGLHVLKLSLRDHPALNLTSRETYWASQALGTVSQSPPSSPVQQQPLPH